MQTTPRQASSSFSPLSFTTQRNKEVVLAYVDAFNRGDIDAMCSLFAPDATISGVPGSGGLDKARPVWQAFKLSTDARLRVDAMIAEGDFVAVRYTERRRAAPSCGSQDQSGVYQAEAVAMEWFEVRDGMIRGRWSARDAATVVGAAAAGPDK